MVLRTSINIAPNTLQDLTIDNLDKEGTPFENYYPKVFSRVDLESMIFDDIIETDVVAASGDERFTFSSTGFNIIQKTFSELSDLAIADTPLIMTPSLDVSVLSDGTNHYAIKDAQARSDIASLQTNKVPTSRKVNNKALSSDITLTASDVGALPDSTVIPTVNNATLTIQKNGTNVQTFTANASTNVTANISVPTKTSDISNDSGYITGINSSDVTTALGYTPADNSNVVKTSGNQTVGGTKTFTENLVVTKSDPRIYINNSDYTKGTALSGNEDSYLNFRDSASSVVSQVASRVESSLNASTRIVSYKQTSGTSACSLLTNAYRADGVYYLDYFNHSGDIGDNNGSLNLTTNSTSSTKIPTMGWVNNPATSTGVVHRTGDETIGGTKTFTNPPVFNMQCYTANNGSSNTNQYKKIATGIKTGANGSIIIPFMFCVSYSTNTSGTYNGKISCRTGSTAGSANASLSGIVLNGNPDFISNGNIVFYLMYKNNYPESDQVTFEVWVYVKNTYQGVNVMPLRIGIGATGRDINAMTWGDNMTSTNALPDGFTAINQIIL